MKGLSIVKSMEKMDEPELRYLIKPIIPKVSSLGDLIDVCINTKNGLLKVLSYAVILNDLWSDSENELDGKTIEESCIEVLKKVTNPTISNTENTIYLARDIVREIILRMKDLIFDGDGKNA